MTSNKWFETKWIFLTSFGWLIAQYVGIAVTGTAYPQFPSSMLVSSPLYWTIFGAIIGLSQWIIVRNRMPSAFRWVLATTISYCASALLLKWFNLFDVINSFLKSYPVLGYFFSGIIIGFAQYLVIKRTFMHANRWIIVVAIGWPLTSVILGIHELLIQLFGIFLFAFSTGIAFAQLSKQPSTELQTA